MSGDDHAVTLCLTSSGRPDLLRATLATLLTADAASFADVIVVDDLADAACARVVGELYPSANILLNAERLGQLRSIDRMYRLVRTPFIFHCEDDWQFEPLPMVAACLKGLRAMPDASVISVRALDNLHPGSMDEAELAEIDGEPFWRRSITA